MNLDARLTGAQRDADLMVTRLLDDLYWVMSYSRWKDEAYWPQFRELLMSEHANLTVEDLHEAREFNFQRYYYQGVGRFTPGEAYARGVADLGVLARLVPEAGFVHGDTPCVIDAAIYGFIANIYFLPIETPLRRLVASAAGLVRHCTQIHAAIAEADQPGCSAAAAGRQAAGLCRRSCQRCRTTKNEGTNSTARQVEASMPLNTAMPMRRALRRRHPWPAPAAARPG